MTHRVKFVTRKRKGDDDVPWTYWVTRPVDERLSMVEELRAEYHGWTIGSEPRLPRVCRIVRRPRDIADAADLPSAD